jgi:hypothetical protein
LPVEIPDARTSTGDRLRDGLDDDKRRGILVSTNFGAMTDEERAMFKMADHLMSFCGDLSRSELRESVRFLRRRRGTGPAQALASIRRQMDPGDTLNQLGRGHVAALLADAIDAEVERRKAPEGVA